MEKKVGTENQQNSQLAGVHVLWEERKKKTGQVGNDKMKENRKRGKSKDTEGYINM